MKAIGECLLREYKVMPLGSPPCRYPADENLICGLYGDGERALLAYGLGMDRQLYLGTPKLVWLGGHVADWDFEPVWAIPSEWCDTMDEAQAAELLMQAKMVAEQRERQYRRCETCGESTMPECMDMRFDGKPTCHSCMSEQGVVF